MADFDVDAVAVAAQPLAFSGLGRSRSTYHVPYLFVWLSNGDRRIVDVKRPTAVGSSEAQFALTRAACKEIGWQYQVFTETQPLECLKSWGPPRASGTHRSRGAGCFDDGKSRRLPDPDGLVSQLANVSGVCSHA